MNTSVPCPNCRRVLRLPVEAFGREARCPMCQATFLPPAPAYEDAAVPPPFEPAPPWEPPPPEYARTDTGAALEQPEPEQPPSAGSRLSPVAWKGTVFALMVFAGVGFRVIRSLPTSSAPDRSQPRQLGAGPQENDVAIAARAGMKRATEILTLPERSAVEAVAFSPDGERVITANQDGTASIWAVRQRQQIGTLQWHRGAVVGLSFSRDGQRLATVSGGRDDQAPTVAKVWEVRKGRLVRTIELPPESRPCVALSPDGERVVTGFRLSAAKVWDVRTGAEVHKLDRHQGAVSGVAYSPDGERILTGSADRTARLWDARTGREVFVLERHAGEVAAVAFSADGSRALAGTREGAVKSWDVRTGKELAALRGVGRALLGRPAFSPDCERVLVGDILTGAVVWDVGAGQEVLALDARRRHFSAAAFSPDGTRVVTAEQGNLTVWDVR